VVSLVLADGWNHEYPSSPLPGGILLQLVYETAVFNNDELLTADPAGKQEHDESKW